MGRSPESRIRHPERAGNGRACMALIACAMLAGACSAPRGTTDAPPVSSGIAATQGDLDAGKGAPMSAWQEQCAAWLEGGIRVASKVEPGLRGAWVEHETTSRGEAVWIAA